jgi:hypothetical protein
MKVISWVVEALIFLFLVLPGALAAYCAIGASLVIIGIGQVIGGLLMSPVWLWALVRKK